MDHLEGGLGKGDLKERKVDQNSFSTDVLRSILGLDFACGLNRPFPSSPQSHFDGAGPLATSLFAHPLHVRKITLRLPKHFLRNSREVALWQV